MTIRYGYPGARYRWSYISAFYHSEIKIRLRSVSINAKEEVGRVASNRVHLQTDQGGVETLTYAAYALHFFVGAPAGILAYCGEPFYYLEIHSDMDNTDGRTSH